MQSIRDSKVTAVKVSQQVLVRKVVELHAEDRRLEAVHLVPVRIGFNQVTR